MATGCWSFGDAGAPASTGSCSAGVEVLRSVRAISQDLKVLRYGGGPKVLRYGGGPKVLRYGGGLKVLRYGSLV